MIYSVHSQLQEVIRDIDSYKKGTVQFCSKNKLVVSLDNMGGRAEEIHPSSATGNWYGETL